MEIINTTGRKRETYQIQIKYSVLWEAALGIAAITNSSLLSTLEKTDEYWREIRTLLGKEVQGELDYVEKNNTWKALLQLLHQQDFESINDFITYIQDLESHEFKTVCLPYIGMRYAELNEQAAFGDTVAMNKMKELTQSNPFFPEYIEFICTTNIEKLKRHLTQIMKIWFEKIIEPNLDTLTIILKTDYESKKDMFKKMNSEEIVHWATGGINYLPEPSVYNVLLIPQMTYRPWNIEADLMGTKVFYYPIANESISPHDKYMPSHTLVLKYKSLGDEARLRIVKLLFESERTLQDITEHLNIGKSTIHHHLKVLRSGKLVNIVESKYRLDKNSIETLVKELDKYLNK